MISDSIISDSLNQQWFCVNCSSYIFPFNNVDDNDMFIENIGTFFNYTHPSANVQNMVFNIFEMNDDSSFLPLTGVDPDTQFYNEILHLNNANSCHYYLEDAFNEKMNLLNLDCFSAIHFNIRSVPRNLDSLMSYLSNLVVSFSVIGL